MMVEPRYRYNIQDKTSIARLQRFEDLIVLSQGVALGYYIFAPLALKNAGAGVR